MKLRLYLILINYKSGFEEEKKIFKERLVELLACKQKTELREDETQVLDKLKKGKKLTTDEFWQVYGSIYQNGPEVKYINPQNWL